jgi:hypothetical protein
MKIAQVSGALLRVLLPSARQLQSHFPRISSGGQHSEEHSQRKAHRRTCAQ